MRAVSTLLLATCLTTAGIFYPSGAARAQFDNLPIQSRYSDSTPEHYQKDTESYERMYQQAQPLSEEVILQSDTHPNIEQVRQNVISWMKELNGLHKNLTNGQEDLLGDHFDYNSSADRRAFFAKINAIIKQRRANAEQGVYRPVYAEGNNQECTDAGCPDNGAGDQGSDDLTQGEADDEATPYSLQQEQAYAEQQKNANEQRALYVRARQTTLDYLRLHKNAVHWHEELAALQEGSAEQVPPRFDEDTNELETSLGKASKIHEEYQASLGSSHADTLYSSMELTFRTLGQLYQRLSKKNLFGANFTYTNAAARQDALDKVRSLLAERAKQRQMLLKRYASKDIKRAEHKLFFAMRDLDATHRRQQKLDPARNSINYASEAERRDYLNGIANYIEQRQAYLKTLEHAFGKEVLNDRSRYRKTDSMQKERGYFSKKGSQSR